LSTASPVNRERPVGPRSRKGVEARARLLEAAKAVFERDGFLDARVTDIALRAGLSHGSYYHYFDSKEQIFREVTEALEDRLSSPLSVILDPASEATPRERIREGIRLFLDSYRKEARIIGVVEQVSRYDDEVCAIRFRHQRRTGELVIGSIRDLQRRGLVDPDINPDVAIPALGAMMSRFAELWFVQKFLDSNLEEGTEQLTKLFVNALRLRDKA
jgi:AcrR family transcriptional regulator